MSYLPFLSLLASALAAHSISVVLIRSGSKYQYASPASDGDMVTPGGNNKLKLVLNNDATVYDTASSKYLCINSDGAVTLSKTSQDGYSINDGYLSHDGSSGFGVLEDKVYFGLTDSNFVGTPWKVVSTTQTGENGRNSTAAATAVPSILYENGGNPLAVFKAVGVFGIGALLI